MRQDSRASSRRGLVVFMAATALLFTRAETGLTQTVTVTALAGTPSPSPTTIGQSVVVPLNATASNLPVGSPIVATMAKWSWSTQDPPPPRKPVVQYAAQHGKWGPAPQGSYALSIQQFATDAPAATLTATFQRAGYWRLRPIVSVSSNNDSPYTPTWQASGRVTIADITILSVSFNKDPVVVPGADATATVKATVTPADAASLVSFGSANNTIATAAGTSKKSPIPVTVTGVAAGETMVVAWAGNNFLAEDPVKVGGGGATKLKLGGSAPAKPGQKFKVYVPTASGGILNVTTDGTLMDLKFPDGTTNYSNNTDTNLVKGISPRGWFTFEVGGAATKVSCTFTQKGQAKTRPWNFYWWTTQGPRIYAPEDKKAESKARNVNPPNTPQNQCKAPDDRQIIPVGAMAKEDEAIVTAGPNGILESKAVGGDKVNEMLATPPLFITKGPYQPFEKYSKKYPPGPGRPTAQRFAAEGSDRLDMRGLNPHWSGHCPGATVASIKLKEPSATGGSPFNAEELKGFWAYLGSVGTVTFGKGEITGIPAGPPKPGQDNKTIDEAAPLLQLVFEFIIRKAKTPFMADLRAEYGNNPRAVWFHAVWKYEATFEEAPGGNEKYVKIANTVSANRDKKPPTVGTKDDRVVKYTYMITYDADGIPDSEGKADWTDVGGQAKFAPTDIKTVRKVQWTDPEKVILEKTVRENDESNP